MLAAQVIYHCKKNDRMIINGNSERIYESVYILRINQHLPKTGEEDENNSQVKLACFMAKIHTRISKYELVYKD